MTLLVPLKLH